jgi:hypothetical protein
MARLEIDERGWSDPRLKELMAAIRNGEVEVPPMAQAMGLLCMIWHDSQEKEMAETTIQELGIWLGLGHDETVTMAKVLMRCGYLRTSKSGQMVVRGNSRRIEKVRSLKRRARDAVTKRWNSVRTQKVPRKDSKGFKKKQNGNEDLPSIPFVIRDDRSSRNTEMKRYRDISSSLRDEPSVETDTGPAPEGSTQEASKSARVLRVRVTSKAPAQTNGDPPQIDVHPLRDDNHTPPRANHVIAAYSKAYEERFRSKPIIRGKEAAAAKRIAEDLSRQKFDVDRARLLVTAYFSINDSWFNRRHYDLPTLHENLNKVKTYVDTGVVVSQTTARQSERRSHNKTVAQQALKNFKPQGEEYEPAPF